MSAFIRILLFASLLTAGPFAAAQGIVGQMGAVELTAAEFKAMIEALPPDSRRQLAADPQQLERVVREQLVFKTVLAEAKQKGWDKRPELQPLFERARDQVIIQSYVSNVARPADGYPSEDELKQFYESNK